MLKWAGVEDFVCVCPELIFVTIATTGSGILFSSLCPFLHKEREIWAYFGQLSGLSLPRGEIKNRGMNKDTKSVLRICLALELNGFCSFAFHIPLSTFTAHRAVCMSSSKLLVVFDRVCNSAFSYVIDHYLVKNNLFDMFHSRIKCRTPKFSNFDFQVSRIPVGVVGSDPLAVTLESHEILCDNVIGTGGHFPAFRPLFLA